MASTDETCQTLFESIAEAACQELFSQYGVTLSRVVPDPMSDSPQFLVCGVIGFSGRYVRGTLVLALTEEPLGRSNPIGNKGQARDWMGELANQLLGRMKSRLLGQGVEISLNLPAVLRGEHLAPLPRKELNPIKFIGEHGVVGIWIEVEAAAGFRTTANPASEDPGPRSGDTLLF